MKHKGRIDESLSDAFEALDELIRQTRAAIDIAHKQRDSAGVAKLIFEQRHNLKVLFTRIERAKKP